MPWRRTGTTRISLPLYVGRLVTTVASASLFMYLIDKQVEVGLERFGLGNPIFMTGVVTVLGIIAWKLWEIGAAFVQRRVRLLRS